MLQNRIIIVIVIINDLAYLFINFKLNKMKSEIY